MIYKLLWIGVSGRVQEGILGRERERGWLWSIGPCYFLLFPSFALVMYLGQNQRLKQLGTFAEQTEYRRPNSLLA